MQNSMTAILEFSGFIFVIVVGTLLHFAYKYSENNRLVGILSPVNESTWEHLKLLFTPMLFYSIFEYLGIGKNINNFIAAKSIGIVLGLLAIVISFYTYTGILGRHFLLADILTFVIGVTVAYGFSWRVIQNGNNISDAVFILIILFAVCFIIFTFCPPHIALFLDPVSKSYGMTHKSNQ